MLQGPSQTLWEHPSMISIFLWQSACSFTVSCFGIKFICQGPKQCIKVDADCLVYPIPKSAELSF